MFIIFLVATNSKYLWKVTLRVKAIKNFCVWTKDWWKKIKYLNIKKLLKKKNCKNRKQDNKRHKITKSARFLLQALGREEKFSKIYELRASTQIVFFISSIL